MSEYEEIKIEAWIGDRLTPIGGMFQAAPADEGRADRHFEAAKLNATEVWKCVRAKGGNWLVMWHEKLVGRAWIKQADDQRDKTA
jgi:hypothetical protein